ncbi:MAG: putative DNA modification/repair radical SAM protein, partial [Oscillospiraceae bacterium]|nr:putative DNA modification/repair radical SAM protein [Oscillospiraceae bacterium]
MDLEQKLEVLGAAAKYDVSCASSGSSRAGKRGGIGNAAVGGICHTWTADGRCLSLLKVLMTNACVYDCAYCVNRASHDTPRATFTPRELAELTIGFYRRNYIEGLFLSSGVLKNADYTTERMIEALRLLRGEYRFNGYIHAKIIPGTNPSLIDILGRLADRLSCNIELPSSSSLGKLAPQKLPEHILTPMRVVKNTLHGLLGDGSNRRAGGASAFAPAGQSTQMIIGASPDTDYTILKLSKGLYGHFKLKRVYFSAFVQPPDWMGRRPDAAPAGFDALLLREHRLYQADWLMRFYGFDAEELLDERNQSLSADVDPKCEWALRHPEAFPVEVNTAPLETLLRV